MKEDEPKQECDAEAVDEESVTRRAIGSYVDLEEIGHGGMGVIYRAHDASLDRTVALKILREDLRSQPDVVARFRREAQAAASLSHPNIVQIYAVGEADGLPYIAMEYVDGLALSTIMQQEGPLAWRRALDIAEQVARALACAHDAHIIHRDIKPPNILIDRGDQAYVTDFGIAKILTLEEQLTVDGTRLGTPQYMSPERCKQDEVTTASDIYSLGVLLFQMISGRLPFEASSSVELVRKILSEQPSRLRLFEPRIPEGVERLVAYLIEKNPGNRPASAEKVCEAISLVRAGKPLNEAQLTVTSALAEFRKSDTPKPSYLREDPTTKFLAGGPFAEFTQRWFGTPHPWRVFGVALLLLGIGIGIGYPLNLAVREDPKLAAARAMDADVSQWRNPPPVAEFEEARAGVLVVQLNIQDFTHVRSGWTFNRAFVELEGQRKTPRAGQRMVCAVDPASRNGSTCVPPVPASRFSASLDTLRIVGYARLPGEDSPLGARVLVQYTVPDQGTGQWETALLACAPLPGTAPPTPVFSRRIEGSESQTRGIDPDTIASLDVKADGRTVVVSIGRGEDDSCYLAETIPRADGKWRQQILTNVGAPIPSAQYMPDGSHVAYLREGLLQSRRLYLVATDGYERDGNVLAEGELVLSPGAFHPDGGSLAVCEHRGEDLGVVATITITDAPVRQDIGAGCTASWHASGSFVVAAAEDEDGTMQMFAIEAAPPHRRRQLTRLESGIAVSCATAGNGEWAMAPVPDTAKPTFVFVDLTGVTFE